MIESLSVPGFIAHETRYSVLMDVMFCCWSPLGLMYIYSSLFTSDPNSEMTQRAYCCTRVYRAPTRHLRGTGRGVFLAPNKNRYVHHVDGVVVLTAAAAVLVLHCVGSAPQQLIWGRVHCYCRFLLLHRVGSDRQEIMIVQKCLFLWYVLL